ncbi:MAG: adenylyltransferase/cytidyltransferase family protein [bacterium]|nr:adenylyltransferase/cytidyltransferase family protein [bacterium]
METSTAKKKILIFGVFDRLHDGHRSFIRQAKNLGGEGSELIAVIARDNTVRELKGRTSQQSEEERLTALAYIQEVSCAVLGDAELGSYAVLAAHKPDIICLGYDQHALADDLQKVMQSGAIAVLAIKILAPHEPERLHSSLLTSL